MALWASHQMGLAAPRPPQVWKAGVPAAGVTLPLHNPASFLCLDKIYKAECSLTTDIPRRGPELLHRDSPLQLPASSR